MEEREREDVPSPPHPLKIGGHSACFTSPHPFKSKRFFLKKTKNKKLNIKINMQWP